jgi:hypothetical protein
VRHDELKQKTARPFVAYCTSYVNAKCLRSTFHCCGNMKFYSDSNTSRTAAAYSFSMLMDP